jgi:hypothetical protein
VDWLRGIYLSIFPVVTAIATTIIGYAAYKGRIAPGHAAYLIVVFALFALCFTYFFIGVTLWRHRIAFESSWGGIGGGLSGWSLSSSLVFLLLSLGLLALLVIAVGTDKPLTDLRERYRAAINVGAQKGIQFEDSEIVGGKLILKGTAPDQNAVNVFWDQLKLANPLHDDVEARFTIKPSSAVSAASSAATATTPASSAPR